LTGSEGFGGGALGMAWGVFEGGLGEYLEKFFILFHAR